MDYKKLADLLFPNKLVDVDFYEERYPLRNLPEGAKVTRFAPSPTGFLHIGALYGALVDERLAHQSNGVFYLRIEDTDSKREVENGVVQIINDFASFGVKFDEGVTQDGEIGNYGPYTQSKRKAIYNTFAKELVLRGRAYPCFCSEEELASMRDAQGKNKENFGYYGKYAKCRDLSLEEIEQRISNGDPYVLRFRSEGNPDVKVKFTDLIKGDMEFPQNNMDMVVLKTDKMPTYHFAHVVDDHLMRTTHVVRGEEWLSTLPFHLELFEALDFKKPKYAHTAQVLKLDGDSKRKLSKRLDPEAAVSYYAQQGYPADAVMEYLLTLLNSNFEMWRDANPDKSIYDFPFSLKKMSVSGALFDLSKLNDISKNYIAKMETNDVYKAIEKWAGHNNYGFYKQLTDNMKYARDILSIGRGGPKPRKDLINFASSIDYMSIFYEPFFVADYSVMPDNVCVDDIKTIIRKYYKIYNNDDDQQTWFDKIRELSASLGFAPTPKEYKANPDNFKGHVGDVSMVLRVAITGRQNSPDMFDVMRILGTDKIRYRLSQAMEIIYKEKI